MTADLFALRSLLFLPASNPRAIAKARESAADLVILDLEDAVKPADKPRARDAALEAMAEAWRMSVAIRVNGIGTEWHEEDVAAVAGSRAQFAILPRTNSAAEAGGVRQKIRLPLLAMVETAAGVLEAAAIAREVQALIAGTNDLASNLRLPADAGRAPLQTSLQLIVLAARAAGITAFDGVFNRLTDNDGFAAEAAESRQLGFDGKSLIHPSQIEPCNRAFAPGPGEIDRAKRLVEAASGGAERFEDEMIEGMHVAAAQRLLARARA